MLHPSTSTSPPHPHTAALAAVLEHNAAVAAAEAEAYKQHVDQIGGDITAAVLSSSEIPPQMQPSIYRPDSVNSLPPTPPPSHQSSSSPNTTAKLAYRRLNLPASPQLKGMSSSTPRNIQPQLQQHQHEKDGKFGLFSPTTTLHSSTPNLSAKLIHLPPASTPSPHRNALTRPQQHVRSASGTIYANLTVLPSSSPPPSTFMPPASCASTVTDLSSGTSSCVSVSSSVFPSPPPSISTFGQTPSLRLEFMSPSSSPPSCFSSASATSARTGSSSSRAGTSSSMFSPPGLPRRNSLGSGIGFESSASSTTSASSQLSGTPRYSESPDSGSSMHSASCSSSCTPSSGGNNSLAGSQCAEIRFQSPECPKLCAPFDVIPGFASASSYSSGTKTPPELSNISITAGSGQTASSPSSLTPSEEISEEQQQHIASLVRKTRKKKNIFTSNHNTRAHHPHPAIPVHHPPSHYNRHASPSPVPPHHHHYNLPSTRGVGAITPGGSLVGAGPAAAVRTPGSVGGGNNSVNSLMSPTPPHQLPKYPSSFSPSPLTYGASPKNFNLFRLRLPGAGSGNTTPNSSSIGSSSSSHHRLHLSSSASSSPRTHESDEENDDEEEDEEDFRSIVTPGNAGLGMEDEDGEIILCGIHEPNRGGAGIGGGYLGSIHSSYANPRRRDSSFYCGEDSSSETPTPVSGEGSNGSQQGGDTPPTPSPLSEQVMNMAELPVMQKDAGITISPLVTPPNEIAVVSTTTTISASSETPTTFPSSTPLLTEASTFTPLPSTTGWTPVVAASVTSATPAVLPTLPESYPLTEIVEGTLDMSKLEISKKADETSTSSTATAPTSTSSVPLTMSSVDVPASIHATPPPFQRTESEAVLKTTSSSSSRRGTGGNGSIDASNKYRAAPYDFNTSGALLIDGWEISKRGVTRTPEVSARRLSTGAASSNVSSCNSSPNMLPHRTSSSNNAVTVLSIPGAVQSSNSLGSEPGSINSTPTLLCRRLSFVKAQKEKEKKANHSRNSSDAMSAIAGGLDENVAVAATSTLNSSLSSFLPSSGSFSSSSSSTLDPFNPILPSSLDFLPQSASAASSSSPAISSHILQQSFGSKFKLPKAAPGLGIELKLSDLVKLGEIGRGVNGAVHKAIYLPTLSIVALKSVSIFDKDERHQFLQELRAFLTCTSDRMVSFIGASFSEGKITMALEYLNRGSLDSVVRSLGALNEDVLKLVMQQLLMGIRDLHVQNFLHRDIKPANFLIDNRGIAKVSDFGLLKQLVVNDQTGIIQEDRKFVGTMMYLAPERISGKPFSFPSDIYAVGLSLVYLATGNLKQIPQDYWALVQQASSESDETSPSLPTHSPADGREFSPELHDFLRKMVCKDPTKRASASELLQHEWLTKEEGVAQQLAATTVPSSSSEALPLPQSNSFDFLPLPDKDILESWPGRELQEPDEDELAILIEAVLDRWYPMRDLLHANYTSSHVFEPSAVDLTRFTHLAQQLGWQEQPVIDTFTLKIRERITELQERIAQHHTAHLPASATASESSTCNNSTRSSMSSTELSSLISSTSLSSASSSMHSLHDLLSPASSDGSTGGSCSQHPCSIRERSVSPLTLSASSSFSNQPPSIFGAGGPISPTSHRPPKPPTHSNESTPQRRMTLRPHTRGLTDGGQPLSSSLFGMFKRLVSSSPSPASSTMTSTPSPIVESPTSEASVTPINKNDSKQ